MKMINPFPLIATSSVAWETGFMLAFCGPVDRGIVILPPANVTADNFDAFNLGAVAGQQAVVFGWEVTAKPCMSARQDHPRIEMADDLFTGAKALFELGRIAAKGAKLGVTLAAGAFSIFAAFAEIVLSAPVNAIAAERTVLPLIGNQVVAWLNSVGVTSLELFCGAATDPLQENCEILMTPLFRTLVQARAAAIATGRQEWVVVSWRTDQSRSFRIVDAG